MRAVAAAIAVFILVALGPGAGAAQAQSEDEAILKGDASEPAKPARAQSKRDDEIDDEDLDEQVFYSGFGVSRVESEFVNLSEAINLEAVMGFRVPTLPWFSLELDISQTIIPGENSPKVQAGCGGLLQPPCPGATGDPDEFAVSALGISAAFKTGGRFYVTGKYGYRYLATSIQELDDDRSGNGLAFGLGYRWGKGQSGVELGYKQLADDVESVGLTFFVRSPRR